MSRQDGRPIRVLIVDDNQDAATGMAMLLTLAGLEVRTCFDGRSALDAAAQFRPDAYLLDINMPGLDGYEVARRVRAMTPDRPPVLATLTAYGDYDHLDRASEVGFDLHFTKPANPYDVAEQISECVRRGPSAMVPDLATA